MLAALLFLLLAGGYFYSVIFIPSIYYAEREDGHRLYFRSVYYAFFLFVFSTLIYFNLYFRDAPVIEALGKLPIEPDPFKNLLNVLASKMHRRFVVILAFIIGITLPHALNWIIILASLKPFFIRLAIRDSEFESLLYRAVETSLPLLITLDTGKVYVAWVTSTEDPSSGKKYIGFLPLLSGFRDEKHQVSFTTSYLYMLSAIADGDEDLDHLCPDDFRVVVPVDRIVNAHGFDLVAYSRLDIKNSSEVKQLIAVKPPHEAGNDTPP